MSSEEGKIIFEREFKGLLLGLYPLVLILSLWIVYTIEPLREFLSVLVPLCFILSAVFCGIVAYLRLKYFWGLEYRPSLNSSSMVLLIISTLILFEKTSYTIIESPDLKGLIFSAGNSCGFYRRTSHVFNAVCLVCTASYFLLEDRKFQQKAESKRAAKPKRERSRKRVFRWQGFRMTEMNFEAFCYDNQHRSQKRK